MARPEMILLSAYAYGTCVRTCVCEYPPMEYENHNYKESRHDISENPQQGVLVWSLRGEGGIHLIVTSSQIYYYTTLFIERSLSQASWMCNTNYCYSRWY